MVEALDGELEIRVIPLEEPLTPKSNFDAYALSTERGATDEQQIGNKQRAMPPITKKFVNDYDYITP